MTLPTNAFATYESIGNREDLTDIIYNISPFVTPFLTNAATAEAKAVNHEWQTDSLAAAAQNAQLEGDDATTTATTATTRLGNICQISTKTPRVTGTQQAILKAGRSDELAYQIAKRAREIKRDMENDLCANNAKNAGSDAVARVMAGLPSWIKTNTSKASDGSDPSVATGAGTRTDGTQRAFTEALMLPVLKAIFDAGGDPDTIMLGSFNKQKFSGFTGNATKMVNVDEKKLTASVDVYESDYGTLKVIPNRFTRTRDCFVLQMDMFAIAYLRSFHTKPLARTGDTERQQLLVEYTLESRNEAASGGVFDLTVS